MRGHGLDFWGWGRFHWNTDDADKCEIKKKDLRYGLVR